MPKAKAKFEKLEVAQWFDENHHSYVEGKETSSRKEASSRSVFLEESYRAPENGKGSQFSGNYSNGGSQPSRKGQSSDYGNNARNDSDNAGRVTEAGIKTNVELHRPEKLNSDLRSFGNAGFGQKTVLMIAEKPSIARTLSEVLSNGSEVWKRHGASPFSPVYEYEGRFHGVPCLFRITGVCGHVFGTNFTEEWNNWQKHEPRELFDAPTVKQEADPRAKMLGHLRAEAKGASALLLWLDCDREGENIAFEVIGLCVERMSSPRLVLRAHFSSLNPKDLQRAYDNLGRPNERLSEAVEARMEVDLKLGVAFSRFITMFVRREFRSMTESLDVKLISYGPCQVPALWFVVKRQDEIMTFVPEPYWELHADLSSPGGKVSFKRSAGCIWHEREAWNMRRRLQNQKTATVSRLLQRPITKARPLPLNTVRFLQKASSQLRIGAHQALNIAEHLYISGLITYPRTETTKHAPTFDFNEVVAAISFADEEYGAAAREMLKKDTLEGPRTDGWDAGDHPPITPIRAVDASDRLDNRSWLVYKLISCHFLMSVSQDFMLDETTATVDLGGEAFTATASVILYPGWTVFEERADNRRDPRATALAKLMEGQRLHVTGVRVTDHLTEPPSQLTESDLLGLMERFGIGTDATMATHIETIVKRGYVILEETSRRLKSLPLGRALVHGLAVVDEDLCSPVVRASIEADVSKIAQGRSSRESVEKNALRLFSKKLDRFSTQASVVPLMLAAAYAEEADHAIPHASAELWHQAVRKLATVNLDDFRPTAAAAWAAAADAGYAVAPHVPLPSVDIVKDALSQVGLHRRSDQSQRKEFETNAWQSWDKADWAKAGWRSIETNGDWVATDWTSEWTSGERISEWVAADWSSREKKWSKNTDEWENVSIKHEPQRRSFYPASCASRVDDGRGAKGNGRQGASVSGSSAWDESRKSTQIRVASGWT